MGGKRLKMPNCEFIFNCCWEMPTIMSPDERTLCPAPTCGQRQHAPHSRPPGPGPAIPMVQCSPFQPGLHSHLPSRQVPCSAQRGWQARWSQAAPIQPSSQRQVPPTQTPWPPQSAAQISAGRTAGDGGERKKHILSRSGHYREQGSHLATFLGSWGGWIRCQRPGRLISPNNDPRVRTILQAKACFEPTSLTNMGRWKGSALFAFPYCQPAPALVLATSKGDRPSEQM